MAMKLQMVEPRRQRLRTTSSPGAAFVTSAAPLRGQEERHDQDELAGIADEHHLHRRHAGGAQPLGATVDDGEAEVAEENEADAEQAPFLDRLYARPSVSPQPA